MIPSLSLGVLVAKISESVISPRSGRRHKAWGGAKRNPSSTWKIIPSPQRGRQLITSLSLGVLSYHTTLTHAVTASHERRNPAKVAASNGICKVRRLAIQTACVDAYRLPIYDRVMSSQRVTIDQAKDQLSDLITTAAEGGEVIIEQNGKPLARLVPATDAAAYRSYPPTASEFATDEDPLAWDANGWENVA